MWRTGKSALRWYFHAAGWKVRPQPGLPAFPRTNRQTRRVINSHDKLDNYLDIYRHGGGWWLFASVWPHPVLPRSIGKH
jgi:hypothetical protein